MKNIQFRILDKELYGASFDLEQNKEYRVGNSMQFDIFIPQLDGASEGSNYFDFSLKDNLLSFSVLSAKVTHIDIENHNKTLVDASHTYEIPCLFEFMGIKIVLCDAFDSWEKWLSVIKPKQEQVKINPEQLENPEMSDYEREQLDNIGLHDENASPFSSASPMLEKEANFLRSLFKFLPISNLSPKNKKIFILTCICSFILILVIIIFSSAQKYVAQHTSSAQLSASIANIQAIKQIEVNLPTRFSNLKYLSNQSDLVLIQGVVKDQNDVIFLQKKFEKFKNIVHFKLLTSDVAIKKLNTILRSQNITLVTPLFNSGTYRLYLTGLLNNMDAINDIELAVSNQMPEVSDLDTSLVYSVSDVDKDIDNLVSTNNLSTRLTLKKNLNERKVDISGYLAQNEINDLKSSVADLQTKYQGLIKVNLDVRNALTSLPFKIVAVNTSGFPSFMTNSGQKVFEGGEIDGMKVDKISATEIVFSGKFPLVLKLDEVFGTGNNNEKQ